MREADVKIDFRAAALRGNGGPFQKLMNSVDSPAYVGGLIQGVFEAILNASIHQMDAYADMVNSVAKTINQFTQDDISLTREGLQKSRASMSAWG